jgi:hypothetical protein
MFTLSCFLLKFLKTVANFSPSEVNFIDCETFKNDKTEEQSQLNAEFSQPIQPSTLALYSIQDGGGLDGET